MLQGHFRRGEACVRLLRFKEAVDSFTTALALNKESEETQMCLSEARLLLRCQQLKPGIAYVHTHSHTHTHILLTLTYTY